MLHWFKGSRSANPTNLTFNTRSRLHFLLFDFFAPFTSWVALFCSVTWMEETNTCTVDSWFAFRQAFLLIKFIFHSLTRLQSLWFLRLVSRRNHIFSQFSTFIEAITARSLREIPPRKSTLFRALKLCLHSLFLKHRALVNDEYIFSLNRPRRRKQQQNNFLLIFH